MKIIKFNGGLGNQLFEYAFGLAVEDYYKEDVYFDVSNYNLKNNVNSSRPFLLDKFNTHVKFAPKRQRKKCINENSRLKNQINKLFGKDIFVEKSNKIIEKYSYIYDKSMFADKKDIYFEGFFQSEKYFKHLREKVLNDFKLKEPLDKNNQEFLERIKNSNSVSLHIRRGDFLISDYYLKCSLEYYQNAINYIAQRDNNICLFVFSDDIKWVKENLKTDFELIFVDINKDINSFFDIELMKNCKHNITANSTFSWWGAWLNENPNKITITPSQWYKDTELYDTVPDEWIKL